MQNLLVVCVVVCSFVYALWVLAPQQPRSRLAQAVLRLPMPHWMRQPLAQAARQQGGCACTGCDKAAAAKPQGAHAGAPVASSLAQAQPLHFVPGPYVKKKPR